MFVKRGNLEFQLTGMSRCMHIEKGICVEATCSFYKVISQTFLVFFLHIFSFRQSVFGVKMVVKSGQMEPLFS